MIKSSKEEEKNCGYLQKAFEYVKKCGGLMNLRVYALIFVSFIGLQVLSCSKSTEPEKRVSEPKFNPFGGVYHNCIDLVIYSDTPGALIKYTTNGEEPDLLANTYTMPLRVSFSTSIQARAYREGLDESKNVAAEYIMKIAELQFEPSGGEYLNHQSVEISSITSDIIIKYTLDGSEPNMSSATYSEPIVIASDLTLKGRAFRNGWDSGQIATATYRIVDQLTVATPHFEPTEGYYQSAQSVSITTKTEGSTIRYTTDGTEPTLSSPIYTKPIPIWNDKTVKAKSYKDGWNDSEIKTGVYAIDLDLKEIEWCLIPPGDFHYGEVSAVLTIDYAYEIMKYEVTNAQYLAYLQKAYADGDVWVQGGEVLGFYAGDQVWSGGSWPLYRLGIPATHNYAQIFYSNGDFGLNAPDGFTIDDYLNHPVVWITWFGAKHFAEYHDWLLPNEKEWEKAARGLTGYRYPWGNTIDGSRANYWNSGDHYDQGTSPVGYFNGNAYQVNGITFYTIDSPSPFNVYDLAGNVWNWTDSFWSELHTGRVVRGGSWNHHVNHLYTWSRLSINPTHGYFVYGFRCIRRV